MLNVVTFTISDSFYFNVEIDDKNYCDLNTLEIHYGPSCIKFSEELAIQRIYDHIDVQYVDNLPYPYYIGDRYHVHLEVITFILLRRFPHMIYQFIPLITNNFK